MKKIPASPRYTAYPEVNTLLAALIDGVRAVLGEQMVGMYLEGSLASGAFDQDSDIDFVVVTREETAPEGERSPTFLALQAMHDRLAAFDSPWAIQLEGFYLSRPAIHRHDPARALCPNIERGQGERLKLVRLDEGWDIHRHVLRERGITLLGPAPQSLIEPVTPDALRRAMRPMLFDWAAGFLDNPALMAQRGYQSYIVLTLCRVLYTLVNGAVTTKTGASAWARAQLDAPWVGLIERAWQGRSHSNSLAQREDVAQTLDFIRFVLAQYARLTGESHPGA